MRVDSVGKGMNGAAPGPRARSPQPQGHQPAGRWASAACADRKEQNSDITSAADLQMEYVAALPGANAADMHLARKLPEGLQLHAWAVAKMSAAEAERTRQRWMSGFSQRRGHGGNGRIWRGIAMPNWSASRADHTACPASRNKCDHRYPE